MITGNGKSVAVLLRKLRQVCVISAGLFCLLCEGTHTELSYLVQVQPKPLAKGESTVQKSVQKIFHFLGVSGIWQVSLSFIFSFYLKEPDSYMEPLGMSVLQANGMYDSLTLAQLYAYKFPSSGSRTTVVLKEGFRTPLGF